MTSAETWQVFADKTLLKFWHSSTYFLKISSAPREDKSTHDTVPTKKINLAAPEGSKAEDGHQG